MVFHAHASLQRRRADVQYWIVQNQIRLNDDFAALHAERNKVLHLPTQVLFGLTSTIEAITL